MGITHKGTDIRPEFPKQIDYSPKDGRKVTRRKKLLISEFEGSYEPSLIAAGYKYQWDPRDGTPFGVVTWFEPITDIGNDTWMVRYMETQQSIWLDPDVQKEMDEKLGNSQQRANFRSDIEAACRGERTYTDENGLAQQLDLDKIISTAIAGGFDQHILENLIADLSAGVEYIVISTPVLARSVIIPEDAVFEDYTSNIGDLFKLPELLRDEPDMHPSVQDFVQLEAFAAGYWLKKQPEIIQQEDGRWKVDYEYWYSDRIAKTLEKRVVA